MPEPKPKPRIIEDADAAVVALRTLLAGTSRACALTGAGASAPSGIPTYRGAGGSWTRYDPARYASIASFREDPSYYWRFFLEERHPMLAAARPNPVHFALAELEARGQLLAVVTQNIDGLHAAAGSRRVIELHGNTRRFHCQACDHALDFEGAHALASQEIPPRCPGCGASALRPEVVMFGEPLPGEALESAAAALREADLVLVVGSSLVVQPAASLPLICLRGGGRLAILNVDPTPLDHLATLVVRAAADVVLPRAIAAA